MAYQVKPGTKNANQRTIIIKREIPQKGSGKTFLMVYDEVISQASRNLPGGVPFKLFLYLLNNQNDFSLDYSPQHFANLYGVHLDSAKKAIAILIEAGYIEQIDKSTFVFHENPILTKPALKTGRRIVKLLNSDTGEYESYSLQQLIDYFDGNTVAAQEAWDYAAETNGGIFYEEA